MSLQYVDENIQKIMKINTLLKYYTGDTNHMHRLGPFT